MDKAVDTSGNIGIIQDTLLECVAPGGVAATVGSTGPGQEVRISPSKWLVRGVSYVGVHQGSSAPQAVR